jgi:hypothetical protein
LVALRLLQLEEAVWRALARLEAAARMVAVTQGRSAPGAVLVALVASVALVEVPALSPSARVEPRAVALHEGVRRRAADPREVRVRLPARAPQQE